MMAGESRTSIFNYGLLLSFLTFIAYTAMVTEAFATTTFTDPSGVICYLVTTAGMNITRSLATLGVIIVGIGAALGRVTWGTAILVAVGVATLMSAPKLVTLLSWQVDVCYY